MVSAIKKLNYLKKIRSIEYVQAKLMSFKHQILFKNLKIQRSCIYIQAFVRRKFSYEILNSKKYFLKCVKTIQRFYKKRFEFLNFQAKLIEKV